ncbi:MAG: pilus assembly protein [Lachnospiraceae bacterium]|nr:pilus assembly protein [Lachnospiraceae bacterium]
MQAKKNKKHTTAEEKQRLGRLSPEGYMTVEATLIMPIVLYVCIFIIYSGFFLYDRCVMKMDAYRAVLRASSIYRQDSQAVYNMAWDTLDNLTGEKYIATDHQYEVAVQGKVQVRICGQVEMPFGGIEEMTGVSVWSIEETAESDCISPVLFIRTCRRLTEAPEEE